MSSVTPSQASLYSRGANINSVSQMLGHSSVKITLDVYGHLMPDMQVATLEALNGIFS